MDSRDVYSHQESMTYRVEYGPSHLADLGFEVGCDDEGVVSARLMANSKGLARRVHPFRVRLDTIARPITGGTRQAQTLIEEKGAARRYRSRFDRTPQVSTDAVIRGAESQEVVQLPSTGHDLLSWMLHLRREVSKSGQQDQARRYTLWDGWKLVWLDVHPGAVEEMSTPTDEVRAQAFTLRRTRLHHSGDSRFEAQADVEELGTIWIEVSPRALPVAMAFRAPIGRVQIHIQAYQSDPCEL